MDNYKINIKNGLDISKVTVALNDLGYVLGNLPKDDIHVIYAMADKTVQYVTYDDGYDYHGIEAKDLTIPQLEDLVVLKRNDVNDANYESVDEEIDDLYFKDSSGKLYRWFCGSHWTEAASYKGAIRPIKKSNPALISGADAFTYLIGGSNDVQTKLNDTEKWRDVPTGMSWAAFANPDRKFRLKPRTIKLEIEIPAPFEPKVGEEYFYINSGRESGFAKKLHDGKKLDYMATQFGAYRTEEEIKQVVEQLRKIRGTNS
ncbi:hypothetical protein ACT43E_08070 [Acinetobacter baumannii]